MPTKGGIVKGYARMWPRKVFDIRVKNKLPISVREALKESGVYVLYRDGMPYYIGKTTGKLFDRLQSHANHTGSKMYSFWDYFSVFVVPDKHHIDEVESILIAAIPTANSAKPKIRPKINLPPEIVRILTKERFIREDKHR